MAHSSWARQSWVTGGSTYPWPLHDWADVRVDANPASLGITSILQDAQAHQRWHPLGDGYEPQPGDWVLFDGHVEVVTKYSGDVLSTVGGDSLPNFSVNAHQYPGPLAAQGVVGFVSNGNLPAAASTAPSTAASAQHAQGGRTGSTLGASAAATRTAASGTATGDLAAIPGTGAAATGAADGSDTVAGSGTAGTEATASGTATATLTADGPAIPGMPGAAASGGLTAPRIPAATQRPRPAGQSKSGAQSGAVTRAGSPSSTAAALTAAAEVTIPGMPPATSAGQPAAPAVRYRRSQPTPSAASSAAPGTTSQQAFINQVAPGAVAAQHTYGVPAAVTIAQAIDESAWGQSTLATRDNNLFGIKGSGPAGSDSLPTQEFQNGEWVTTTAPFRVYDNIAESIDDHGKLLATSGSYTAAMAASNAPNGFAQALTGVYATDPNYGANLISLMRRYNLYRFDPAAQSARAQAAAAAHSPATQAPATQAPAAQAPAPQSPATSSATAPSPAAQPPTATGGTSTAQPPARPAAGPREDAAPGGQSRIEYPPDARTRLARSGPAHVHADGPRARAASGQPAGIRTRAASGQPAAERGDPAARDAGSDLPGAAEPNGPSGPHCRPVVQRAASVRDTAAGRIVGGPGHRVRRLRGRGGDPGPSGHPRRSGAAREHVRAYIRSAPVVVRYPGRHRAGGRLLAHGARAPAGQRGDG